MTLLRRLPREPLLHFLLLGALLFAYFQWQGGAAGPGSDRIVITGGLIDHLASGFTRTWQRPPTDAELKGLIDDYIKEEIAAREAVAMGLDRDDTIIRRRLRQKLEFLLVNDAVSPPTDAELEAWVARNPEAFRIEPKLAFRQVYISPDRRGLSARADAKKLLPKLRAAGSEVATERMGDASMLPSEQPLLPLREVTRAFGGDFAQDLLKIEPGQWVGPVESPYGLHLVLVRERVDGGAPALAEIRPLVERELLAERRREDMKALYDRMLGKYTITVAPRIAKQAPAAPGDGRGTR